MIALKIGQPNGFKLIYGELSFIRAPSLATGAKLSDFRHLLDVSHLLFASFYSHIHLYIAIDMSICSNKTPRYYEHMLNLIYYRDLKVEKFVFNKLKR